MDHRSKTLPLHDQHAIEPESSSASSVSWLWFVEWLAEDEEADPRILRDAAKEMTGSGLIGNAAEYARELLSLRCLEGLVKLGNDAEDAPRSDSKIGLDLNERCSVALLRITTDKAGITCMESGDDFDVSKWDIQSFVEHKRAKLRRCDLKPALEIIDEMIDSGTDPAALLRESSLIKAVFEGVANGVLLTCDGTSHHQVAVGNDPIINLIPQIGNGEDLCQNRNKEGSHVEKEVDAHSNLNKSTEDNHVSNNRPFMVSDDGYRVPNQQGVFSLHKDDGGDSGKEPQNKSNQTEKYSEIRIQDDRDFHTARDNQKPDSDTSQVAISHNVPSKKFRDVLKSPDVPDAPNAAICKKQQTVVPVVDEINITNNVRNQNVDGGPVGESEAKTSRYGFQDERESFRVEYIPTDVEEYHNKEVDVTSWKNNFMSSEWPTFDRAEPALCMICNKSGPLSTCISCGCPFAVHGDCLGSAPFSKDSVNFRCPFCACSLATAEYLKAKKKVDNRKKELIAYLDSSHWSKFSQSVLNRNKKRHLMQDGPSYPMESHDVAETTETHRNQAQNAEHVEHVSPEIIGVDVVNPRHDPPSVCVDGDLPFREVNYQGTGRVDLGMIDEPFAPCAGDILTPREQNSTTSSGTCQPGDDLAQQPLASGGMEHQNSLAIVLYKGDMFDQIHPVRKSHPEVKVKPARPVQTVPTGGISKPAPNEPYRGRKRKVPWTSEEEEKLKEGVKRFYDQNARGNVPWVQILEFGATVFQACRTAQNLKDKWRNICNRGG